MQFNIFIFIIYTALIALIYYLLPMRFQRYVLIIAGIGFYMLWDIKSIALMAGIALVSFFLGYIMDKGDVRKRMVLLVIGLIPTIGTFLLYRNIIGIMPLGISYVNFRILSYLFDIYYQKREPEQSILNFMIYVFFFPQIMCGPIDRSGNIIPQIKKPIAFDPVMIREGVYLIIIGLFKKVVIADRLSGYVSTIYNGYTGYNGLALVFAMFLYPIQLYCDFAGYSEIALGLGQILGIRSIMNFDRPFLAKNMKSFWNRWHISLQIWLRDYVYFPLGGGKKGRVRKWVNILAVFLISAVWHGNGSGYILWGLFFALLNILPQYGQKTLFTGKVSHIFYNGCCRLTTYLLFSVGVVFFRLENVKAGASYLWHMVTNLDFGMDQIVIAILPFSNDYYCVALFLTVVIMIAVEFFFEIVQEKRRILTRNIAIVHMVFCTITTVLFGVIGQGSFIYAQY